uniref:Uncharacterized protein n=1 Tax=Ditylum brightwellii TaxID=49249 RepID=A0A7S4SKB4_9STRA
MEDENALAGIENLIFLPFFIISAFLILSATFAFARAYEALLSRMPQHSLPIVILVHILAFALLPSLSILVEVDYLLGLQVSTSNDTLVDSFDIIASIPLFYILYAIFTVIAAATAFIWRKIYCYYKEKKGKNVILITTKTDFVAISVLMILVQAIIVIVELRFSLLLRN